MVRSERRSHGRGRAVRAPRPLYLTIVLIVDWCVITAVGVAVLSGALGETAARAETLVYALIVAVVNRGCWNMDALALKLRIGLKLLGLGLVVWALGGDAQSLPMRVPYIAFAAALVGGCIYALRLNAAATRRHATERSRARTVRG